MSTSDKYTYEVIDNENDARICAQLLAEEFVASNSMIIFDQLTPQYIFDEDTWPTMAEIFNEQLSFLARHRQSAIPSAIHTALVELVRRNLLHFVVSSHTNGLHLRSTMLTKIHENSNLETCQKCHEKYLLDFLMRTATAVHDHTTNRKYFQHSMSQL
ncbi:unnamed protein product [Rotaria sordida]|uniref:Uncharacterized protein n=1 Tax=Rotaria sordida TaxID=392033 RepID=A0A813X0B7_9BILA|nr:unnamed protein product [Rotaria sordida]